MLIIRKIIVKFKFLLNLLYKLYKLQNEKIITLPYRFNCKR